MKDRYTSASENLRSDRWQARVQSHRDADIRDLKRFLPFFQRYPGVVTQMNLSDYKREFPDFPARCVTYLKGKRTLLRKKGLIR